MRHVAGEAMLCSLEERAHVDILSLAGVADVAVPLPSVHTPTALPGAAFVAALAGDALSDPPSGADGGPVEPGRGEAEVAGDDGKTAWGSGRVPLVPSAVGLKTEAAGRSSLRTNAIAQGSTDVVGGFGTGLEQAEERGEGQEAEGREGRMEDMAEESLSVRFMEGLSISSVRVEITDGREGGGSAAGMSKERPTEADASLSDDKPPAIPGPSPDIETAVGYLSAPRPASLTTQSLARYWLAAAGCKSDGAKNAGLGSLSGRMSHLSGLYESESFVIALPGAGLPETGAGVPAVPVVEVTFEPQEEPQEERDGESGLGSGRRSVDPCETARTALLASTPMAYQGLDLWGPLTQGGNEVECGAPETVQTQNCKGALHVARAEGLTVDEGDLARDIGEKSREDGRATGPPSPCSHVHHDACEVPYEVSHTKEPDSAFYRSPMLVCLSTHHFFPPLLASVTPSALPLQSSPALLLHPNKPRPRAEALSRDLDPTLAVLRLCERWEEVAEEMDASGGGDALPHVAVLHQLLEDLV